VRLASAASGSATSSSPAFVSTITDACADFGTIGRAALEMVARRHGIEPAAEDRDAILGTMRSLPPHPEVPAALERLRSAGLRLAALTNSTEAVATAQLANAGLAPSFERILSADAARRLKPARETFETAASALGVDVGGMRLVAVHAWDVEGAVRAGPPTPSARRSSRSRRVPRSTSWPTRSIRSRQRPG
jgi:2-haloacid dehalogenase